jgi:hypothetical protein
MKATCSLLIILVLPMTVWADEEPVTVESLVARFEATLLDKIATMSGRDWEYNDTLTTIGAIAQDVYGKHPDAIRARGRELMKKLPPFDKDRLSRYKLKKQVDDLWATVQGAQGDFPKGVLLAAKGWKPQVATSHFSIVVMTSEPIGKFSHRTILTKFAPDKYFRLPDTDKPTVVVQSLNDLFIVELRQADSGVFIPGSAKWLVPKELEKDQP